MDQLLRELGLRERVITGASGALTAVHLARHGRFEAMPETCAAAAIALFVGGARLQEERVHSLFGAAAAGRLRDAGLLATDGGEVRAPMAVLPVGGALVVCPWHALPDDSSFHLLGCLPTAARRWLDVGTGAAFAPLLAARSCDRLIATDIDADSIRAARLGVALAGRGETIDLRQSDLFDAVEESGFDLISFNAPIEGADVLLPRFYGEAPAHLAEGGEIIVHSLYSNATAPPAHGSSLRCRYTPEGSSPAFGITSWRPHARSTRLERSVELTVKQPHLRRDDLEPAGF